MAKDDEQDLSFLTEASEILNEKECGSTVGTANGVDFVETKKSANDVMLDIIGEMVTKLKHEYFDTKKYTDSDMHKLEKESHDAKKNLIVLQKERIEELENKLSEAEEIVERYEDAVTDQLTSGDRYGRQTS